MESIFQTLAGTYCCHLDAMLTLNTSYTNISEVTGYSASELEADFQNHLLELILPEDQQIVRHQINKQLQQCNDIEITYQIRHKDGAEICILNKGKKVVTEDNQEYLYGILTDITKTNAVHATTNKLLKQYQIILAQTENIVFELDFQADTIFFSDTWFKIFGYQPITNHILSTLPLTSHIHESDISTIYERLRIIASGIHYQVAEVRIAKIDGTYLWCRIRATGLYGADGKLIKIVGIIINIDDEKKVADSLLKKAERDALTKLLNNTTARKQVQDYLNTDPNNSNCALLIIDLDNFKYVNDHFGHMYGDHVLIRAANEIKHLFRSQDIVSRIGGDEFMVLMKDVTERNLIEKRCNQLIASINSIFHGQPILEKSSCSIGVALCPDHGITYSELFQHADQALYNAKDLGKGCFSIYH